MTRIVGSAVVAFLLVACGEAADDVPPPEQPAPAVEAPPPADAPMLTADIMPLDGSGVQGSVQVDASAAQPVVTVSLRNAPEGVYQGHIHGGTCADRTRALTPLQPVTVAADGAGSATSTVDMPAETLLDGDHIVVYHEAGGSPGASVACAELRQ